MTYAEHIWLCSSDKLTLASHIHNLVSSIILKFNVLLLKNLLFIQLVYTFCSFEIEFPQQKVSTICLPKVKSVSELSDSFVCHSVLSLALQSFDYQTLKLILLPSRINLSSHSSMSNHSRLSSGLFECINIF